MGITDQLKELANTAIAAHKEFAVLNSSFERLERDVARLIDFTDKRYDTLRKENEELCRRVTMLEAAFDAAVKASVKDALVQVARECAAADGQVPDHVDLDCENRRRLTAK